MLIKLTQGEYAEIDDDCFNIVDKYSWYTLVSDKNNTYYAATKIKRKTLLMHRLLLGLQPGEICDHKDGNGLNNKLDNIRKCTFSQNQQNKSKTTNTTTSKYKGVYLKRLYKWYASIRINTKFIHLGVYDTEIEAARAYNTAALRMFGQFAKLNKIGE